MKKASAGITAILVLFLFHKTKAQYVGVGIALPLAPWHVATIQSEIARLENQTALNTGVSSELYFKTGTYFTGAIKTVGLTTSQSKLSFFTYAGNTTTNLLERMTIVDNGSVGINQNNPTAKFEVNGTVKITDGSQLNNYVLTCDNNGLASWKAVPNPVADKFGAAQAISMNVTNNTFTLVPFSTESYDPGADFASGFYTVPVTGVYHFDVDVISNGQTIVAAGSTALELWVNNSAVRRVESKFDASSLLPSQNISCDLSLTAGNTVSVKFYQSNGTAASMLIGGASGAERNPHFSGHRVY